MVDEHEIGNDVLDLLHLVRRHDDGAGPIEVVVQERIVELFAKQEVEPQRGLIQHQQPRVDGHDHSEMELGHHSFRQLSDLAGSFDLCFRQETLGLRPVEAWMHAADVVEQLRNPHPARQHGDVGNEADIAHELIALGPGIAPEHSQFAFERSEAEN